MRFEAPETVEAAVALLAAEAGDARILAGGTDLLVQMKSKIIEPDLIVDIKRIQSLQKIVPEDGGYRIGASVPNIVLGEHEGVKASWPGVVEAAELIGSTQVQGRATICGNLCNASPAADSVPAMVAAGAIVKIAGPDGEREVAVEDFTTGPGTTVLTRGELVVAILLPAQAPNSADAYMRFTPRTEMDIAVTGCGVHLSLDDKGVCTAARVVLGAVAARVLLVHEGADALIGTRFDDKALGALSKACTAAATPIDDKRGTVEFRRKISGVIARRTATMAHERAKRNA